MESTTENHDQNGPSWLKRVPMVTGVLAGLAGFLTVRSANMSNQAIYNSNQAVLHQARSSDHWTEYQADSIKKHIDTAALATMADSPAKQELVTESKAMTDRQQPLMDQAAQEEKLRDDELHNGQLKLQVKDIVDYAGVTAQLGIALASVAALTRRRAAYNVSLVIGILALGITGYAIAIPYIGHFFGHH